jgi:hypothetical protein
MEHRIHPLNIYKTPTSDNEEIQGNQQWKEQSIAVDLLNMARIVQEITPMDNPTSLTKKP